jgi:hypothetical protein
LYNRSIEFWAVATPSGGRDNGLGLTCEAAMIELAILKDLFPLLPEPAAMKLHRIDRILTFNVTDFARYPRIEAIHPQSV